jgi:hypothetical protein
MFYKSLKVQYSNACKSWEIRTFGDFVANRDLADAKSNVIIKERGKMFEEWYAQPAYADSVAHGSPKRNANKASHLRVTFPSIRH